MTLIRQLDLRRKFEERERKRHQMVLDRLIQREKRLATRKRDLAILTQIRYTKGYAHKNCETIISH